jgi:copper transport protein
MRRAGGLIGTVLLIAVAQLALAAPALGHAQLLSSVPGSGEVLSQTPEELRLAFSEPLAAGVLRVDVQDANGEVVAADVGERDPADPRQVLVDLGCCRLPDGAYTVTWLILSAADGHATRGYLAFGVGAGAPVGAGAGDPEGGQGHPTTEVEVRLIASIGPLLATGLAAFAWLVLRPVTGRWPARLARIQALALGVGAVGSLLAAVVAGGDAGLDPWTYLRDTRPGALLLARAAIGVGGGLGVLALVRSARVGQAVMAGGLGGLASLLLMALGSHAAAFSSAVPVLVIVVHLAAASVWFGGVMALGDLAVFGPKPRTVSLAKLVPRFSALAIVSIALIALTGLYSGWLEAADPIGGAGIYPFSLRLKVIAFLAALAFGAVNYLEGGRRIGWLGGFERRIAFEGAFAIAVLALAGNLAAASPPGLARAIPLTTTSADGRAPAMATLAIQPGRPGPNRFVAVLSPQPPDGATVQLRLQHPHGPADLVFVTMTPDPGAPGRFSAEAGVLRADPSWRAFVLVDDGAGGQTYVAASEFSLDRAGVTAGREPPSLELSLATGGLMLVLGLIGLYVVFVGGGVPRVERRLGRRAALVGSALAVALGLVGVFGGPPF